MGACYVLDAVRTPFGRYGGGLAGVRPDDLATAALRGLLDRSPGLDPAQIGDVLWGDANGAGEDNRNVGRMAVLLAGLPTQIPAATVNRLCGSSLEAAIQASRAIETGDASIVVVGGVESMSRAPWVVLKNEKPHPRGHETMWSTTLGWRMVNPSTLNDGAGAMLLADEAGAQAIGRDPIARVVSRGAWGVDPDVFGIAPVEAANIALRRAGIGWEDVAVVELNEAFASQCLADISQWKDLDPDKVNPNGGAIALGHPLGASGVRILGSLAHELKRRGGGYGVAALCIGVGQGLAVVLEA